MSNTACVLSETGTAYYSRAPEFNPGFLVGMRFGHFVQVWFAVSYYMSLCSEFRVMTSVMQEWCSVRVYLQLFVGGLMSYLRYLCLFAHSGVQSIMSCVFLCLCPVYPMLPVSLDCSFLIASSLFYNVYLCVILTCRSHYINVQVKVNYFALLNLKKKIISTCILDRWLKQVLRLSNIDIVTAHSLRGTATSGAFCGQVIS